VVPVVPDTHQVHDKNVEVDSDKQAKVTCFNFGQWGHFSTDCKDPRLCFICQTSDHVGRDCPEWMKPVESAQYLGSASQGLGFFHVDVAEEVTRSGYMHFLENCVVLTVEEGGIEEQEIVDNMQRLFDPAWHWQFKEIEEYKFLVRFPPHKKIADTLISDITYFKMNKLGVMVSLRAWNGDIEPYDTLDDVLVQISGIPPKWSTWKTFIQISSTLGNLLEVEWNSVFASFFVMVRVKLAYKDV
jgi:hypothetical protein